MEKTSIMTKIESNISKMEVNRTDQTEAGVRRNIKSEVVIESSIIKTEIVTENIGCRKSKISGDASVDQNNITLKTDLKVPLPHISGGDFARIGEVASTRAAFNSDINGSTTVANGASGECRPSSDQGRNVCENRTICKKRKTHDGNSEVSNDSFVRQDSQQSRPPMLGNFRRRSAPLKDRSESVNISQEFGEEDQNAANITCTNNIYSFDSAGAMKMADELTFEASSRSSPRPTKETEKSKDDSQTGEVFVNTENSVVDSINVPSKSKEENGSSTKEEVCRKLKVTSFNRSCKKELIKNLEKSVTDLVNYFENLQKSSLEGNSMQLADDISEKSMGTVKKRPKTGNKYPGESVSALSPKGRHNKYTKSGCRENFTKTHENRMLDGSSKIVEDLPCIINNNVKHYPKERTFIISDPIALPLKKDSMNKGKCASHKKDKNSATVENRITITYFGIIMFVVVFAASLKFFETVT